MTTPKDGGPAYPVADTVYSNGQVQFGFNGMTMRQAYKIAALQGMLANPVLTQWGHEITPSVVGIDSHKNRAALVFKVGQFADACIAEDEAHARQSEKSP